MPTEPRSPAESFENEIVTSWHWHHGRPVPAATLDPYPPPMLIGLGGYLRAGKDALADFLVANHGFTKLGMSDVLAQALYVLNPRVPVYDGQGLHHPRYQAIVDHVGYTKAKENPEVRRLLQTLGTEVGRNLLGPDIWVDAIGKKIRELRAEGYPVVLTGVRFPNELAMVRIHGGHTVWVARDGTAPAEHAGALVTAHSSESTLTPDDFEFLVPNHGTLDDLALQADALVARFTP